jgi:hypothetical protein
MYRLKRVATETTAAVTETVNMAAAMETAKEMAAVGEGLPKAVRLRVAVGARTSSRSRFPVGLIGLHGGRSISPGCINHKL